jgi:hypothetical protein
VVKNAVDFALTPCLATLPRRIYSELFTVAGTAQKWAANQLASIGVASKWEASGLQFGSSFQ